MKCLRWISFAAVFFFCLSGAINGFAAKEKKHKVEKSTEEKAEVKKDEMKKSEDEGDAESEGKGIIFKKEDNGPGIFDLGIGLGANFYTILGPRLITTELYKIKLTEGSFVIGFTGGIDGIFYPAKKHSISVGAYYEQRKINLKAASLKIFAPLLTPFTLFYPFPVEKYVLETAMTAHYFNFPVIYRVDITDVFYLGFGVDVSLLYKAVADSSFVIFKRRVNLKNDLMPVDFGGRIITGFVISKVFLELSVCAGILDFEKYPGIRRSFSLKFIVGYRFFR